MQNGVVLEGQRKEIPIENKIEGEKAESCVAFEDASKDSRMSKFDLGQDCVYRVVTATATIR